MKNIITILVLSLTITGFSQAYTGRGDKKLQVGISAQSLGNGIHLTLDQGLGENMSFGFAGTYLLSNDLSGAAFFDRFDLKGRFNANIGNVLTLPENMDLYPGLNIGTKSFGAHLGFRYFFTDGFGLYAETSFPIATYSDNYYSNQSVFSIGASFNL